VYRQQPSVPEGTSPPLRSDGGAPAARDPRRTPRRRGSRRMATPWESDAELVRAILAGSRPHFDLLYAAYFPRVYRFALKRLRDRAEAEDVTQEVFVTVFRVLHTYAGTSSLLVWIFGITRNHVNRRFRGTRPRLEPLESPAAAELASGEVAADRAVDARRVLRTCERLIECELTPLQRRIFHLKHLRRQSIRAIAVALGKSEDAVKANLYRIRRSLADAAPELEQILSA
jgi:RNA polymerase sigma-70 factor, ECF subfamily